MHHHKVQEVMTADPATVTSTTPLKHVAEILIKQNVSAVPVLSLRGRVLGIVAETDLLRKEELQRDPDGGHSIHLSFRTRRNLATAETAGEIMSAAPVAVRPDATIAEAARLMDGHRITCLPVTDEAGKLLGVVGPRELLRIFIRSDEEIAAEIVNEILVGYLGTNPALVRVEVTDGVVRLAGELERKSMVVLIRLAQPRADGGPDRSAARVTAIMALRPPEPLTTAELEQQLGEGGLEVVLEKIVAAWKPIYDASDVVVVEGLSAGPAKLYASSLNQALAQTLDADVVLADSWPADADADGVAEQLAIAASGYVSNEQERVVGCVVHGLPGTDVAAAAGLRDALAKRQLDLIAAVPHRPELTWLRVRDLVRELRPEVLHEGDLSRRIRDVAVMARGIPGGLHVLDTGRLIVVPGDRHEVVMAAYLAELSGTHLAALLLSSGTAPDPRVSQLTRATAAAGLPVLLVDSDSYHSAARVRNLDPGLPVDDLERIEGVTENIADALDPSWLETLTSTSRPRRLSPAAFRYQLSEQARAADALVVLPEGAEPRTMRAAVACAERGIARCLLLGTPDEVAAQARHLGLRLPDGVTVVDPRAVAERYVVPLAELRRHKGWTEEVARERLADPVTVGTMMLRQGEVDGLVSGAAHTTATTVRPALQIIGTKPGVRLVSSIFFMCLPDQVVVYGDCAINPQPSAEDLADIAIQSAASARTFGIEPRVALISFSTGTSGVGTDVDKVTEATQIAREREPALAIDGPLQYDAAAIASVGQAKRPGSPVAGQATVFIFPDLDTGNTTYKAVQRSAQVVSIGPMLQGLAKPVNDLSRGALVDDIIYTVALTAIQARGGRSAH
jgi:phosphate acetyltransferase